MGNLILCKIKKPYLSYSKGMIVQLDSSHARKLIEEGIAEVLKQKKNKKACGYHKK